jgi:hypothetical protein
VKRELILGSLAVAMFSSCSHLGRTEQPSSSARAPEIRKAMNETVIPEVDLENVPTEDALKFWEGTSRTYNLQHFKFVHVMSYPITYTVQTTAPGETRRVPMPAPAPAPTRAKVTVRRKNITSEQLLDAICRQANLVWTIMGRAIVIKPNPAATDAQQ